MLRHLAEPDRDLVFRDSKRIRKVGESETDWSVPSVGKIFESCGGI